MQRGPAWVTWHSPQDHELRSQVIKHVVSWADLELGARGDGGVAFCGPGTGKGAGLCGQSFPLGRLLGSCLRPVCILAAILVLSIAVRTVPGRGGRWLNLLGSRSRNSDLWYRSMAERFCAPSRIARDLSDRFQFPPGAARHLCHAQARAPGQE